MWMEIQHRDWAMTRYSDKEYGTILCERFGGEWVPSSDGTIFTSRDGGLTLLARQDLDGWEILLFWVGEETLGAAIFEHVRWVVALDLTTDMTLDTVYRIRAESNSDWSDFLSYDWDRMPELILDSVLEGR